MRPLRCGELARTAGVSPDTIRYYERARLVPKAERSSSGYRLFPPGSIARVKSIRSALSIGFSVRELRDIYAERDRGGAPCRRVRKLVGEKLAALEIHIRDLRSLRRQIADMISDWDSLLSRTPVNSQAHLLERLDTSRPKRRARNSRFPASRGQNTRRSP